MFDKKKAEKFIESQVRELFAKVGPKLLDSQLNNCAFKDSGECQLCGKEHKEGMNLCFSLFYFEKENIVFPYCLCMPCYIKIQETSKKWRIKYYDSIEKRIIKTYGESSK